MTLPSTCIDSRITINEALKSRALNSNLSIYCHWGLYWKNPHLLIGGGTGGGKTVKSLHHYSTLKQDYFVDILYPKNSDLARFKNSSLFMVVYTSKEDIIQCFKENVAFMETLRAHVYPHPNFKPE